MGASVASATGLSTAEVAERIARGETNAFESPTSRSAWSIIRANVFTLFNAIIAACFLVLLLIGRWQDALFGVSAIANTIIGSVQEFRAKRSIDLALMHAPHARVLRDGASRGRHRRRGARRRCSCCARATRYRRMPAWSTSARLQIDESMLTGESDPSTSPPATMSSQGRSSSAATAPRSTTGRRRLLREPARRARPSSSRSSLRAPLLHQPGPEVGGVDHRADRRCSC